MPQAGHDLLQQAVGAHQRGDIATAERLYRRVLAQAPKDFHALHLLGVIRAQQRNFAEAERLFTKALKTSPGSPEALANRGNVLSELGRHHDAIESLSRAVELQPGIAGVHFNLGNALKKARRYEAAVASYGRAIELQPNYLPALFNLADMLRHLNRQAEAMATLRRILAVQPNNAEAKTMLGKALQEAGQLAEAVEAFEQAIALDPTMVDAYFNLSGMASGPSERYLPAMEALAREPARLTPRQRAILHFALGRIYENAGRYDDAFRSLTEGNRIKRSLFGYDEAATRRRFERLQRVFAPTLLAAKQGAGSPSEVPIFILGFPRSGTTLTEQILASHPAVHGAGELNHIAEIAASLPGSLNLAAGEKLFFPECLPAMPAEAFRRLGEAYLARLQAIAPAAPRVTDKMPANYMFVGLIHLILPRARILHLRRDPIDTCVSCFSLDFGGDLDYANDLAELGRYYRMYDQLMAHWREILPPGTMLEVGYETLVDDLEGETRRILDFCGLPWDERCLAFHEADRPVTTASVQQVRRPIYRSSLRRWRRYETQLGPLLEALGLPAPEARA